MNDNKIIAMMRIKNEEEWLLRTLEMASQLVDGFVVLDDGSTDRTPDICRAYPKVIRYEYQDEPIKDEARDKDRLLQWALEEEPDWILALDGDEVFEDAAPEIIRAELAQASANVTKFAFNFLYMWDRHDLYRIDGRYSNLRHPRLFRVSGLNIDPHMLSFARTRNGANFHCGNVPCNLPGHLMYMDVNIKHYGYFDRGQRERKLEFYRRLDPANWEAGNYDHLVDEKGMVLMPWRERTAADALPSSPDPGSFPGFSVTPAADRSGFIAAANDPSPLIAIIYRHSPMSVGRMFKFALSQLGANFISVGGYVGNHVGWPIDRNYDDYIDVPDILVDLVDFHKASHIVGLVEKRCGKRPAMILQIDGDTHVCNDLGFRDIKFVTIATDPHMKSPTYAHAAGCSTYFFCMQSVYMGLFGEKTRYVAYGYDPEVHFIEPEAVKIYDVSCIGFQFPQRVEFGKRLREMGLNVRFENGPIFDEYRRIVNESWICFNLSAADDTNMRVFETLACGTLLISNMTTDMGRFFREGVDYVAYGSFDEAVEKILYYLEHKDELAAIAESGHRAVREHTYANRLAQLFREIGFDHAVPSADVENQHLGMPLPARAVEELPCYYRHVRPEILSAVPSEAKRILDVGCGAGMLGKALKEQNPGRKVTGIEMNREAVHHARANLDEAIHADLETFSPPFRHGEFDCVIFADVLEHLRNPWRIARLYASFLRPGGKFITSIPNIRYLPFLSCLAETGYWRYQDEGLLDNTHLRFFSRREFLRLLDYSAIRCESVRYLGTERCAQIRPSTPERAVTFGKMSLSDVSDSDFAEMSAFQMLFIGSYQPDEGPSIPKRAKGAEDDDGFTPFSSFSDSVELLYETAVQLINANRFKDAIPVLKKILRMAPNHEAAHNDLGLLYYDQDRKTEAVSQFEYCANLSPDNSDALKNLASLYVELGEYGKGIEVCRKVLSLDPSNAESVVSLGNLNFLAGKREEARAFFSRALALDPQNGAAIRGMDAVGGG